MKFRGEVNNFTPRFHPAYGQTAVAFVSYNGKRPFCSSQTAREWYRSFLARKRFQPRRFSLFKRYKTSLLRPCVFQRQQYSTLFMPCQSNILLSCKTPFYNWLLALIALALLVWSVRGFASLTFKEFLKRRSCFKNIFEIFFLKPIGCSQ